jgi:hypothetical protein
VEELRVEFHEDIRSGRIPYRRGRARSKQTKDLKHWQQREERTRILNEAHHDVLESPGEIDALTNSETLHVSRGEVLKDPKQRPYYLHPCLQL